LNSDADFPLCALFSAAVNIVFRKNQNAKASHHRDTESTEKSFSMLLNKCVPLCALCASVVNPFSLRQKLVQDRNNRLREGRQPRLGLAKT